MDFFVSIPLVGYIIFGLSIVLAAITAVWSIRRANAVISCSRKSYGNVDKEKLPPLSIIVYTCDDSENLAAFISAAMNQDYPTFEVIVVDASYSDSTRDLLLRLSVMYHNLYHTFIPPKTENVSRKKLALMLGLKAAKYDFVLLASSCAIPQSDKWLQDMATGFAEGKDVVIGYSYADGKMDMAFGNRMRAYDQLCDDVQYLSYAIRNKTYRANGNNLAYRKQLFFDNKGFHSSYNLVHGDDDLFVCEISTRDNTTVCLSRDAQLKERVFNVARHHSEQKMSHGFTARYLHTWAMRSSAIVSALRWCIVALLPCAYLFGGIAVCGAVAFVVLVEWIVEMVVSHKVATVLHLRKITLMAPFFALLRPFYNFVYRIKIARRKKSNFTWQRRKTK